MPIIYVSDATGDNADDGSTEALAKLTIAGALAVASDGDIIAVKDDGIYLETVAPNNLNIKIVGYTGTFDLSDPASMSTQVVVDGESSRDYGYNPSGGCYIDLKNFRFINHVVNGVHLGNEGGFDNALRADNVSSNNNSGFGFAILGEANVFNHCSAEGNSLFGFVNANNYGSVFNYCKAIGNASSGFVNTTNDRACFMNYCVSHNNGDNGVYRIFSLVNCVIDGNATAFEIFNTGATALYIKNSQITNNSELIASASGNGIDAENCNFYNNTPAANTNLSDLAYFSDLNNLEEDPGYVDYGNDDFTVSNSNMKQRTVRGGANDEQTELAFIGVGVTEISSGIINNIIKSGGNM